MKKIVAILIYLTCLMSCGSSNSESTKTKKVYTKALVSFSDYEKLTKEVKDIRSSNLISFNEFLKFSKESNTIVLDTRAKEKFITKHIKGAINLPFTEFTQTNLKGIIPDLNTRILIYCNNNFKGDDLTFASKLYSPEVESKKTLIANRDSIMLPLNIPTYINLYGYGYRNIMELDELVHIDDTRLELGGDNGIKISTGLINSTVND